MRYLATALQSKLSSAAALWTSIVTMFGQEGIGEIVLTDSVAVDRLGLDAARHQRVRTLSVAGLFAECLHEIEASA